jgi:hypothetical protein
VSARRGEERRERGARFCKERWVSVARSIDPRRRSISRLFLTTTGATIGRRDLASGDGGRELPPEDAPLSLEDTLSKMAAREVDCAMAASESTGRSARDADLQVNHTGRLLKKSFWDGEHAGASAKKKCTRKKALRHVTRLG